ncbi:MAG: glycosyltransferase family 4 protein [Flavobacteriaceae bacterium]
MNLLNNNDARIVFVENEDLGRNSSGGVMSYLINLSNFLRHKHIRTILVGSGKVEGKKNDDQFSEFYSISKTPSIGNFSFFKKLFFTDGINFIAKNDIIHVQRPEMVIPLAIRKRNKIICTLHGGQDLAVLKKKGRVMALFYKMLQHISFRLVDQLIAVDKKNLDRYVQNYPWIKSKIHLVPISVNTNRFFKSGKKDARAHLNISEEKKVLLFIGRLEYEKNVEFIIESFKALQNDGYILLIAGNGSQYDKLIKLSADEPNILFLGEVNNDKVPQIINSVDVLVLASFFEGSPTVVKEALCCGVPILSTDVGDVKEVIESTNSGYIMERNKTSFKTGLEECFFNIKVNTEKTKDFFSHHKMGKKTVGIYNT